MKVVYRTIAKQEFVTALEYYKQISIKLAKQFNKQLSNTIKYIAKFPLHIPIKLE
ncbi:MAG: hypothetical protein R2801_06735 [Chitinophagales bacterium]